MNSVIISIVVLFIKYVLDLLMKIVRAFIVTFEEISHEVLLLMFLSFNVYFYRKGINPLMPGGNRKVTHI